MADTTIPIDADDTSFEREVLARSRQIPVVVDFWAAWCAPCRSLGPLLERVAAEHAGRVALVKVDVDAAPDVARAYDVRSIPLVLGFRDGQPVAEFSGAQPEAVVRALFERLLPTPADARSREGDALWARGEPGAASHYEAALADDPRHPGALLGLARVRAAAGERGEALELLGRVVADGELGREAERLAAELRTRGEGHGDAAALRARVDANPDDLAARLALGRALAAGGCHEEALGELLDVVRRDPGFDDQAARKAMLDLFEVLGGDHPLTARFRSELARALFR